MRIIVCVKQIRYTYARTGKDPEQSFLAPEDHICRVNPYDEAALEFALRAREQLGESEVFILTLGPLTAETDLRRCFAMGADRLYRIETNTALDGWTKSGHLTRAIKHLAADLVLCGKTSLDTANGQIGAFIAHRLGMSFVSAIVDLKILENTEKIKVHRRAGRGAREVIECDLPAVLSVEPDAVVSRIPTYGDKKRAQSAPIEKLHIEEQGTQPKVSVTRVFPPRPRPKRLLAPESGLHSFDRIQQLLSGSRIEKKGEMLYGDPESQTEGIIAFLKTHGLLKTRNTKEGDS